MKLDELVKTLPKAELHVHLEGAIDPTTALKLAYKYSYLGFVDKKEIFRNQGINIHGKTDHRSAVRAVVIRNRTLLMIYSPVNGDFKFPGGGVGENESHEAALKREVAEECGMALTRIVQGVGCVIEYGIPMRSGFDVFKMTSSYYLCEVDSTIKEQHLDDYEEELEFRPVWVDAGTAIQINKTVLRSETKRAPMWTAREVFMLEYIKDHYLSSSQLIPLPEAGN